MKNIAFVMAALLLTLTLASCNNANTPADGTTDTTEATTTTEAVTEAVTEDADAPAEGTFGAALLNDFRTHYAANPDATAEELAGLMITNENIPYMMGSMPVEVGGYLNGFADQNVDDATTLITGYKEGAMFSPMIGVVPFVGYVFTVDEAEIDTFVATLKERADVRWNICTEADQTVIDVQGDKVFFTMCPISTEVEE